MFIALVGFVVGLTTLSEGATTRSVSLNPGQSVTVNCAGGTLQGTWSTPLVATCAKNPPTPTSTTTSTSTSTTTTSTTTTTTAGGNPPSSATFVQADDTGTFTGNTTSLSSGTSHQVLAHNTAVGHSVVLMIQTLTNPGTQTDTVTSVNSAMGTFQFVNSFNDGADYEIWVCLNTTGASDAVTVNTPTNAWDAFAVEFNAPATGFINGGGSVSNPSYLANQSWTVSPEAAGNIAVMVEGHARCLRDRACGALDVLQRGVLVVRQRDLGGWQVAPSSSPLTASWVTAGGESSSQAVVLEY